MDIEGGLQTELSPQPHNHEAISRAPEPLCAPLQPDHRRSAGASSAQNAQQLAFAGLRAVAGKGQFNAVKSDAVGELYLLLDQKDGVRVLKTDADATEVLGRDAAWGAGRHRRRARARSSGQCLCDRNDGFGVAADDGGGSLPGSCGLLDELVRGEVRCRTAHRLRDLRGKRTHGGDGLRSQQIESSSPGVSLRRTLPVTPSAIIQTPAAGSIGGNGFVECFRANGTALVYATYLSGLNGDTSPTAIAADADDNAYVAGYTTSTGYPTVAAVVPERIGSGSGFLTKLTPAGDGIVFSTFVPGSASPRLHSMPRPRRCSSRERLRRVRFRSRRSRLRWSRRTTRAWFGCLSTAAVCLRRRCWPRARNRL